MHRLNTVIRTYTVDSSKFMLIYITLHFSINNTTPNANTAIGVSEYKLAAMNLTAVSKHPDIAPLKACHRKCSKKICRMNKCINVPIKSIFLR